MNKEVSQMVKSLLLLRFTTLLKHMHHHCRLYQLFLVTFRDILFERSTKIFTVGGLYHGYHSNSVSIKGVINIVT